MNPAINIRIGFPLATTPWEFVLVQAAGVQDCTHGWFTGDNQRRHFASFTSDTGAGTALNYNRELTTRRGLDFFHVTAEPTDACPNLWRGHSDTAACTLALAQGTISNNAPIVLVSCDCDFSTERGFSGAKLGTVSISRDINANARALLEKWTASITKIAPVMALVLFHRDADILMQSLREKQLPVPRITAVDEFNVSSLALLPGLWPIVVSVQEHHLPLLAEKLGINPHFFTPREPTYAGSKDPHQDGSITSRPHRGDQQPSAKRGLFRALGSSAALKVALTLTVLGCLAATRIWKTGYWDKLWLWGFPGPDQPAPVAQDLGPLLDGPSLVIGPLPLPPPPDPVDAPPKRQPTPGMVRQFPGGQMVLVSSDKMPSNLVPFWIDRTEVTTEVFEQCVGKGSCSGEVAVMNAVAGQYCNRGAARAQYPINCITYDQAAKFCQFVGKRPPTAAEWDYAALGGTGAPLPWGTEVPNADALCWKRDLAGTCPVGQHPFDKSPLGALDMGGNVGEWTSTKYYPDPQLTARIFRGLSWGSYQLQELFPAKPHGLAAEKGQNNLGIRCAKTFSDADLIDDAHGNGGMAK